MKMIYYGLLGLSLLALLFNYKKLEKRHLWFLPILVLALLVQLIAEVLQQRNFNHIFLFHVYVPVEYLLLCGYYWLLFSDRRIRIFLVITSLILILFCFQYYYSGGRLMAPDYSHFVIESILVTILVVSFFYQLFMKEEHIQLGFYPDFWINTGNLFFYSGCLFVMGLYYSLAQKNFALAEDILKINHFLNLALYLFYTIAFTCTRMVTK